MVHYFISASPELPAWASASGIMNAAVVLDQGRGNIAFTNLDEISGKVIVRCSKPVNVNSIIVKLEGESRSRLSAQSSPDGNTETKLEYHKILYRVQMAFPSAATMEGRSWGGQGKSSYTISAGSHEYPFSFKLPFNNSCATDRSPMPAVSLSMSGLEIAKPAPGHVKTTLPPTLSGFPGEAEIRYFVKATIAQTSIFKGSVRAFAPFTFFPIEPPRPSLTGSEVFARQKHAFESYPEKDTSKPTLKTLFGGKKDRPNSASMAEAPRISLDMRLPDPAILTCNQDIPLRLIVKKLNASSETVYLQSVQVSLIGHTKIRAQDVHRTETNSWVIVSKSNLGMPIGLPTDAVDTETIIDDKLWKGQILPNTVAPSFVTCNIIREYELDVRVGLSYAGSEQYGQKVRKGDIPRIPQNIALPFRLDCQVFSGITPPPQLLEAMAQAKADIRRPSRVNIDGDQKLKAEGRKPSHPVTDTVPATPVHAEAARPSGPPDLPARSGDAVAEQHPPMYSDAPPSYEDAMASGLAPVNVTRPEYAPPPVAYDDLLRRDEKKGWVD